MYYYGCQNQWISEASDFDLCGERLREVIEKTKEKEKGFIPDYIPAGTVMVFTWAGTKYMMFQVLLDIPLTSLKNATLIPYEQGSIIFIQGTSRKIPTLRFRDCMFPTFREFERYVKIPTV